MKLVLLSGGSGKRLWPLSNDSRSKQFLKILSNEEGQEESMVQRVYRQIKSLNLDDSSVIATSKSQVEMLRNQLGSQVEIVTEPNRRDTFPAIALAATYLYSEQKCELDEVIGISPVDSYVEDEFFNKVKELENILLNSKADLALIGVRPTHPSEKYGYIVPEKVNDSESYLRVNHFIEKPIELEAENLIKENALWNCGVFAFKLRYIIELLEEKGLPSQYYPLLEQYESLPKISFDFEVVENAREIIALPYQGSWKDLGTWNTLTEEMEANITGNGIVSEDSKNTHLINELDLPISILGLSNIVVAASPDGILVTDKDSSPRIKELVNDIYQRPMYEERRWGWYRVLDYSKMENGLEVLTKRICIETGANLSYQSHNNRTEVWNIVKGNGAIVLDDKYEKITAGDVIQIPLGSKHSIKAETEIEIIEIQSGTELVEEDIVRYCFDWSEIIENCLTAKAKY